MKINSETIEAQNDFLDCYRGRTGFLYHLSYLRRCKSELIYHLLKKGRVQIAGSDVFDYAFGAGTFFRQLPSSCKVYGVELDTITVTEVSENLRTKNFKELDLDSIEIPTWEEHRLLARKYDVLVCSHILEHLDDPVHFLKRLKQCLEEDGVLVCLVPINETVPDPHHVQVCNVGTIQLWAKNSGLELTQYLETDHWNYWPKRFLYSDSRTIFRKVCSLGLGVANGIVPQALWWKLSRVFGVLTFSKATQAGFVLKA